MKIKKLFIKKYKNLKEIDIDFSNNEFGLFIGDNGSGKSNLLEALINIFKGVMNQSVALFEFKIEYSLSDGKNIEIQSDENELYKVKVNNKRITLKRFKSILKDNNQKILPDNILVYYSGHSSKMKELIDFSIYEFVNNLEKGYYVPRKFFYLNPDSFPLVLLSILGSELEDIRRFVKINLKIESLESFEIVLDKNKLIEYTSYFIETLKKISVKQEDFKNITRLTFEAKSLSKIIEHRDIGYDRDLFKYLDMAYNTKQLKSLSVNCRLNNGEVISHEDFSEGEKQYLMLNAVIEFFGYKDTLYLFDEPDTFFHPAWQREFLKDLKKNGIETQMIITTHSPVMLSNVEDEDIYIVHNENIFNAISNGSLGRDVNGILSEIMGVSERPEDIKNKMDKVYEYIAKKNLSEAKKIIEELRSCLSENDPFFLEVNTLIFNTEVLGL